MNHIGDCDYYSGKILAGGARWEGGIGVSAPYPQLVVFNAQDLSVINVANLHADLTDIPDNEPAPNPGHTASALAVDEVHDVFYLSSYTDAAHQGDVAADRCAVYSLNTILSQKCEFVGWYNYVNEIGDDSPDGDKIYYVQGLAYAAGHLYCTVNSGNIYVLEPYHD